jgi:hypothetical protein
MKDCCMLSIILLILLSLPVDTRAKHFDAITAAEGVSLSVDFGNGTIIQFYDLNGTTVLDVTSAVLKVQVQWFGPFAYIRAIEGIVGEGQYGWQYWVNGEFASVAVNLFTLEDNDTINWVYSGPESQSQLQYDPTLLPGIILVSVSAIGYIAIVYIQTSRRLK